MQRGARLARYVELTASGAAQADLIVWPEYATEAYLEEASTTRDTVLHATRADLILGGPHYEAASSGTRYHNSAYLIRAGRVAARYDKHRLVPLAEDARPWWRHGNASTSYTAGDGTFVLPASTLRLRERHALRAGIEHLLQELDAVTGPEELLTSVGDQLDTLVSPRRCAIYAPLGDCFAPVFERGEYRDSPPSLSSSAAALVALRAGWAPLDLERWAPVRGHGLPHDERTALEHLGAAVLLPVRRGTDLAAVICLGAKRSGDVYTATDLTLLAAVADKVSTGLLRFDTAIIMQQERTMNEALLRYVPQPVAARLTRGEAIEGGERDVSVLFVDIRGYTTYSEARAVGTVFSMLNRYIEAVSAVIQRRGGTVVEFLGDGVMAVFGAPDALPDHARVSVQAAREVVATVRRLALGPADPDAPIAVGVGIASGRAFVGNIRTSDRLVYTAVGDVVNLASRIQSLTRELRAAVAIDARTHRTAGDCTARFERHERVRIRGRTEPVDVYALPVGAA
jgi:class 3 adenylate cyclase